MTYITSLDFPMPTGISGTLPPSLLSLSNLWELDIRGTSTRASSTPSPPQQLPPALMTAPSSSLSSVAPDLSGCSTVAFSQPRLNASVLSAAYAPRLPAPQVLSDPAFDGFAGCQCMAPAGATLHVAADGASYSCDAGSSAYGGLNSTEKAGPLTALPRSTIPIKSVMPMSCALKPLCRVMSLQGLLAGLIVSSFLVVVLLLLLLVPKARRWFWSRWPRWRWSKQRVKEPAAPAADEAEDDDSDDVGGPPAEKLKTWKREMVPGVNVNGQCAL